MQYVLSEQETLIIKRTEYNILKEIKRICIRHNIHFFLIGGTLIGAIRHHGMIPWDDDIDIGLLRNDYEIFLEYAKKELPKHIKVVNYHTDDGIGEPFTKVMDVRGKLVETFASTTNAPTGIFVDVFPIDNVPDFKIRREIHRFNNYTLRKLILLVSNYNFRKSGIKKILYSFLKMISVTIGRKKLIQMYEKNAVKYEKFPSKYIVILGSNYGYKADIHKKSYFKSVKWVLFEDEEFPVPVGYDHYLREVYGDYMQLPPKEERVGKHKLQELDLSELKRSF